MKRKYSEKEIKKILNTELEIPTEVEEKIRDSYRELHMTEKVRPMKRSYRKLVLVAAAVTMLAATSVVALAASGFFSKVVQEEDKSVSYKFETNYEMTPHQVKVKANYIPEGYTEFEEGKYDRDGQHKNGISICGVNAAWLDMQEGMLDADNLASLEKTTLDGMEAHLLSLEYDKDRIQYTFDKRIYLFNPQEGYVAVVYGGNDLSMDELKKVADNLEVTVDKDEPVDYVPADKKALESVDTLDLQQEYIDRYQAGVSSDKVLSLGDTFNYGISGEVEIAYTDAKLVDSTAQIEGYEEKNFFDYQEISPWMNEDGTIKPYERMTYTKDENGMRIEDSGVKETVGQKFLVVKGTMKNNGNQAQEGWAWGDTDTLVPKADGGFAYSDKETEPYVMDGHFFGEGPQYFDKSQYRDEPIETRNHFFFYELQPGEELSFTLVWLVDEDMTDNMFLQMNLSGMDGNEFYIDVRQ